MKFIYSRCIKPLDSLIRVNCAWLITIFLLIGNMIRGKTNHQHPPLFPSIHSHRCAQFDQTLEWWWRGRGRGGLWPEFDLWNRHRRQDSIALFHSLRWNCRFLLRIKCGYEFAGQSFVNKQHSILFNPANDQWTWQEATSTKDCLHSRSVGFPRAEIPMPKVSLSGWSKRCRGYFKLVRDTGEDVVPESKVKLLVLTVERSRN